MSYFSRIKNRGLALLIVALVLILLAVLGFFGLVWNGVEMLIGEAI